MGAIGVGRRGRLFVGLAIAALLLASAAGAAASELMLGYAADYARADDAALDLQVSLGELTGRNWVLVRSAATPGRLAATQDAERHVLRDLATLEHSRFDRNDIHRVAKAVRDFVATSDEERRVAAAGSPVSAAGAGGRSDTAFHGVAALNRSLIAELRKNGEGANRRVSDGIVAMGLLYVLATATFVWWAARRRRRRDRLEVEASSAARYESLIEHGSDLVVLTDHDGTVRYVSPTLDRLLGYAEATEDSAIMAAIVHPEDAPILDRLFEAAVATGEAGPADYRLRNSKGEWRVMELTIKDLCHVSAVGAFVWSSRDVTDRRRLEHDLERAAFHDSLTLLANRALFVDRLEHAVARAKRSRGAVTVLLADLDRFKAVNDGLGHDAGDAVLGEVGRRLERCVRPGDTVARLGGDEFTILLEDDAEEGVGQAIAQRMLDLLRAPIGVSGSSVRLGVSIGIAESRDGAASAAELLRDADTAMYAAKAAGRGQVLHFEPIMHERVHAHLRASTELDEAIDRNQLEVFYQPTFTLADNETAGAEALVRWHHPERGLVLPASFIPIAEETGQILRLGRWVLAQACAQAAEWQQLYPSVPPRTISVNLSARQLANPGIVDDVRDVLHESSLPPGALILEITESVLMDDIAAASLKLRDLKDLGVRLAIDDFGTGYSSLAYLHQLPIDILKIDRTFTEAAATPGCRSEAFIQTIIDLGRKLHLTTVAEGIETETQARQLRAFGCDVGQGHWFAHPMPAADVGALFEAKRFAMAS